MKSEIRKRHGSCLPHWTKCDGIYSVTFRLHDSIPQEKLALWRWERQDIEKTARQMKRRLTQEEMLQLQSLNADRIERYLDNGHGACWLRQNEIAEMVAGALRYFDRERYQLLAWCIMPNHVHVILQPLSGWTLSDILQSWKSFTAKRANKLLERTGAFWQRESYDHLIRDLDDLLRSIDYIWRNPEEIGEDIWKWRWKAEFMEKDEGTAGQRPAGPHAPEAHATEVVSKRTP